MSLVLVSLLIDDNAQRDCLVRTSYCRCPTLGLLTSVLPGNVHVEKVWRIVRIIGYINRRGLARVKSVRCMKHADVSNSVTAGTCSTWRDSRCVQFHQSSTDDRKPIIVALHSWRKVQKDIGVTSYTVMSHTRWLLLCRAADDTQCKQPESRENVE